MENVRNGAFWVPGCPDRSHDPGVCATRIAAILDELRTFCEATFGLDYLGGTGEIDWNEKKLCKRQKAR